MSRKASRITAEEFAAIVRMLRLYELDDKFFNPLEAMQTRALAVKALHKLTDQGPKS